MKVANKHEPFKFWNLNFSNKWRTPNPNVQDWFISVLLSHKNWTPNPQSPTPLPQWEVVDMEEQQLRQKLDQLTENISDKSSDEEESSGLQSSEEIPAWSSPQVDLRLSRIPTRPTSRPRSSIGSRRLEEETDSEQVCSSGSLLVKKVLTSDQSGSSPQQQRPLQEASITSFRGSTAVLVDLEDKVAQTAADVQNVQSQVRCLKKLKQISWFNSINLILFNLQVSYIENRIAAMNSAEAPLEKRRPVTRFNLWLIPDGRVRTVLKHEIIWSRQN